MLDIVTAIVLGAVTLVVLVTMLAALRGAPYVPSRKRDVHVAFSELYALGGGDVLVDLGSGDGKVLRQAAEHGAQAIGFEINPFLVLLSRWLCRGYPGVSTRMVDMWLTTLPPKTTVVYMFATSRDINKMMGWVARQATEMGRSLYVISYGFKSDMPLLRSHGAHHLYLIEPLQGDKAQV